MTGSAEGGLVRALLVEDDPADGELIEAALRRGELEFTLDWVRTEDELRQRLDSRRYDVVLADYRLGGWTAMDVLAELRARDLDAPLLVVTGTIGEERAVECLREGVTDCVFKHELVRLPLAVGRALAELRERREHAEAQDQIRKLSVAVDQSPASVVITDTMGTIEYVNRRFTEMTGYGPEEALGANPRILKSGRTPPTVYEGLWRTILQGRVWRGELLNRRKNGDLYWAQASVSPMRGPDGVVTHFVAVEEDVSEQRWAEGAIRDREERLRQIADNINEVFFVVDSDFRETLFISPAYEEVWGRSCRSAYEDPKSFMDALHSDDRPTLIGSINRIRAGESPGASEFRVVHPSGEVRWVRSHASPVFNEEGVVYRIAGVALDITERKEAEDRLRESESRFRTLIDASFDAIAVTVEGVIHDVNDGFRALLGYEREDLLGKDVMGFIARDSVDEVRWRIGEGVDGTYELGLMHKDGHRVVCEAMGKSQTVEGRPGRLTALRDVTGKRQLEAQLRQAQKLEAVGRLAGGVAHDFNNLLTVILTEVQLLRQNPVGPDASPEPLGEALEEIETAANRAGNLTRQLLAFSRRDVVAPEVLDPGEVVEGLNKMLRRLIGEDVDLTVRTAPKTATVRIDRGHLEQVVVNLVVNARDAMPKGGHLRIEVQDVVLDEAYAAVHPDCRPGPHVMIAISDTGVGMSEAVRSQIFEPFFTTKPEGKGTGLGLATSYGIVRECGGFIGVYSEVGVGTTMKVYIPRSGEPETESALAEGSSQLGTKIDATVLAVEDDAAVRRGAVRALERLGCRVLAAASGAEALEILDRESRPLHLLFVDVVMPGMSGPELAERVRELRPGVKVLYTTGYTADMAVRSRLLSQEWDVLTKPYTPQDLANKLTQVLMRQ